VRLIPVKAALVILAAYLLGLSLVLARTPAAGTDSERFSTRLKSLGDQIFFWHESMYILGEETWVPDLDWKEDLDKKIASFMDEMRWLPESDCANQAKAIVQAQGLFIAATQESMPAVERAWKETADKLPLTCGEF
jgi:hypothetical protein